MFVVCGHVWSVVPCWWVDTCCGVEVVRLVCGGGGVCGVVATCWGVGVWCVASGK